MPTGINLQQLFEEIEALKRRQATLSEQLTHLLRQQEKLNSYLALQRRSLIAILGATEDALGMNRTIAPRRERA